MPQIVVWVLCTLNASGVCMPMAHYDTVAHCLEIRAERPTRACVPVFVRQQRFGVSNHAQPARRLSMNAPSGH